MKLVFESDIDKLYIQASQSPRLRSHLNLHNDYEEKVQRLLIAMQKGSYVEPHYHKLPHQWEMFTVLQGVVEVELYRFDGSVKKKIELGQYLRSSIMQLDPNDIHSVRCLSERALILEVKEGPFISEHAKCFPSWS